MNCICTDKNNMLISFYVFYNPIKNLVVIKWVNFSEGKLKSLISEFLRSSDNCTLVSCGLVDIRAIFFGLFILYKFDRIFFAPLAIKVSPNASPSL